MKEKFIEFAACQQIVDEHRLEVEIVRGPDEKRGCNIRNKIEDGHRLDEKEAIISDKN